MTSMTAPGIPTAAPSIAAKRATTKAANASSGQPRGSRPKGDARRKALLDAAEQLLEINALESLTYRAVSEQAGIPESSAYHFFPDLPSIYRALQLRFGVEFDARFMRPITKRQATSWQAIVGVFWERAADFHKRCPVNAKLTISGKVPLELKMLDRAADTSRTDFVMGEIDRYFVLPQVDNLVEIFHIGAELGNQVLTLSMLRHGKLTASMIGFAKVAMSSFVATYIGQSLQLRPPGLLQPPVGRPE